MRYLKSRNNRSYQASINGVQVVIPSIAVKSWFICSDEDYKALIEYPTIKGLIDCGAIIDTEVEPDDLKNSPDALIQSRSQLENEIKELKAKLENSEVGAVQKELDEVKAEALATISEKDKEIEALKAEALATISEKDKEIEALKAKLAKANKNHSNKNEGQE